MMIEVFEKSPLKIVDQQRTTTLQRACTRKEDSARETQEHPGFLAEFDTAQVDTLGPGRPSRHASI